VKFIRSLMKRALLNLSVTFEIAVAALVRCRRRPDAAGDGLQGRRRWSRPAPAELV